MLMSAILDYVMPDVPSCPSAFALDKIRLAAREFFSRSAIWRAYFSGINTVLNQRQYALAPDGALEADVTGIAQAWYRGTRMYVRSPQALNEMYVNPDTVTGAPFYYHMVSPNTIDVYPLPNAGVTAALKVWGVLAPKTNSAYLRDEDDQWKEEIAAGAKEKLMLVPGKPYSNPQLAQYWMNEFNRGIARAGAWFKDGSGEYTGGDITITIGR